MKLASSLALLGSLAASSAQYAYETKWWTANIDNFNAWGPMSGATYQMRYLINDTYWKGPGSPIFYYTGNEGDITLFAENTGLMWDLAPSYGALLVFGEHRYYGESMPFGSHSYDNNSLGFLSSQQALADYAYLLDSLKTNLTAQDSPVISFGGSYGGMLAGWSRIKYPETFLGAIAASAPVLQFTGLTDPTQYNKVVTNTFNSANPLAAQAIFNSWGVMTALSETDAGRQQIQNAFGICSGQINQPSDVTNTVFNWLSNAIGYMAMGDYPYPANFLGPMPGNPVNVSVAQITNANPSNPVDLLTQIRPIANIFYNYTGQAGSCYNLNNLMPPSLAGNGWNVQTCGEMVMPIGQYGLGPNGSGDMFWPAPWDLNGFVQSCQQQFSTTPRPRQTQVLYHGLDLSQFSNIVWSNGNLDPWSSGGVTPDREGVVLGENMISILIQGGAHHADIRAATPFDPPSFIEARKTEALFISKWLSSYYESKGMKEQLKELTDIKLPF